ncbi:MAG: thioredoxin family protein [Prevotellaceae bacterium]|nr:thioredoxin family protein [Prevotellaceae bacterium]
MRKLFFILLLVLATTVQAQTGLKKVYDESIDPMTQIDKAVASVQSMKPAKFIICQVGGNWCPWCLRFADFISKDSDIMKVINDNFVYLHVNYNPHAKSGNAAALMKRLNNPQRFGFPVFVVLDDKGNVLHIQDSSFLEEGKSYNKEKVLRFFQSWTPAAVRE